MLAVGGQEQGGAGGGGGECGLFEDLFFLFVPTGGWVVRERSDVCCMVFVVAAVGEMGGREVACLLAGTLCSHDMAWHGWLCRGEREGERD